MSIVEEKTRNNAMTQKQFEESQMKWHKGILDQTEKMTKARRQSWDGKVKDVPSTDVTEKTITKEKK